MGLNMRKFLCALSFCLMATTANAVVYYPPKPVPLPPGSHTCWGCAAGVTSFLGVVAALALYDFQRRWTCSGDYLGLGGPGFSEPMPTAGNVKPPPLCGTPRRVLRTRG
jgi:hypothetical protein